MLGTFLAPKRAAKMLLLPILAIACSPDNEFTRVPYTDVFYQEPTDQVDILWVIDNSQSMADQQAEVASKFDDFIYEIESTELDFHLGVVTTDLDNTEENGKLIAPEGEPLYLSAADEGYEDMFRERVQVGIEGSDKERGIDAAYKALSEPLVTSYNYGFLRSDATLSIIYVSDENDCSDRNELYGYEEEDACYSYADKLVPIKEL
ncbi:MAG: hypothetical protein QGG40_04485, partial [Myxococcota bacterium]|nr:hypothetical protein [Myxococcota bacterium]